MENVHKFTQYTHFLSVTKYYLCWLNNLFMARFQLIRMSSCAKNKQQMCSVNQHQCWWCQMCGKLHKFSKYTHFLSVAKYYLCWLNNLFMARFQLIRMSSYAKNKVQMCSVSVDVAKCVENVYKFTQFTHFLSVTKKDLSWLNNLFMAKFQLNRMSTYVKNKL